MKKLNQICCLAFVMASLTYGDPVKRLNVHDLFHTIWNRNLDRSAVTVQMLSRSSDEPLTTGNIQLPHLDAENVFVPLSSDVDEEYKETTVRYEQDFEGIPVIGDDIVLTYDADGELINAFGSAAMLNEKEDGHPCQGDKVKITKETAIDLAKAADEDEMKGTTYEKVKANMAIYNGKCVYVVDLYDAQRPAEMYNIVDVESGSIVLRQNVLPTLPKLPFNYNNNVPVDTVSERKDLHRNERGGTSFKATGPGGNEKTGQYEYGSGGYGKMLVTKWGNTCTMDNSDVVLIDCNHADENSCTSRPFSFPCPRNTHKPINGAYSPVNDAFYSGNLIFKMYLEYTKRRFTSISYNKGEINADKLFIYAHVQQNFENAYYSPARPGLYIGDGQSMFYPLSGDIGVMAHEIGHWFTATASNLKYADMSGGLNEAFSDMAAIASYVYTTGKDRGFEVGADCVKGWGKALRYMANPPKDGRSIEHASQFYQGMDPHFSSGVFNKAFYYLATTSGWNVKKAFTVMARANVKYWTTYTDWNSAGSGVMEAACDLGFSSSDVQTALQRVGITSRLKAGRQCGGGGEGSCVDLDPANCPGWANLGNCQNQYAEYMKTNCKKSCNLCGGTTGVGLLNANKNCWWACDKQQGPCSWCGDGLCCRKESWWWSDTSNGCDGSIGGTFRHKCIERP